MTAPTQAPIKPLAAALFGWALGARAAALCAALSALLGAAAVAMDYARPREGLSMPLESAPGFYAALGAGTVAGVLLIAGVLRFALLRSAAPASEIEPKPDVDLA